MDIIKKITVFTVGAFILLWGNCNVYGETKKSSVYGDYVLSAGGVSDGEYVWTIPYETYSFSKIDLKTGRKVSLAKLGNFRELAALSGYRSGAYYENDEGQRFIYLAPYEVTSPLARINLDTMKIDYPVRNVGYYFGSCLVVEEEGGDYLWLFPSKTKPEGAPTETEIVRINLSMSKKERPISTKIGDKYYAFSDAIAADKRIWLLPAEEGQPLMALDADGDEVSGIASQQVKKIYSGSEMSFSKITTGAFDGNHMWFVCENVSFIFNDSYLYRCGANGDTIDKIKLSKDQYLKATIDNEFIYLFAGAEGMSPKNLRISRLTGESESVETVGGKGYIPADVVVREATDGSEFFVVPFTNDGKKQPTFRLIASPEISANADTSQKRYRNYRDKSVGCPVDLSFIAPEGYETRNLYWLASEADSVGSTDYRDFISAYEETSQQNKNSLKLDGALETTVLADKNGYYSFMAEYAPMNDGGDEYEEKPLFSVCSLSIDNIYERLPITITRFNIEDGSDSSVIESVTHSKDFGAAFSFDGSGFIKVDPPMDLVPSREVFAKDYSWRLEAPLYHTIDISDGEISTASYFAEVETAYRIVKTDTFYEDENIINEEAISVYLPESD